MEVKINNLLSGLQDFARQIGYELVKKERLIDYVVHEYSSYGEYRQTQIHFNKKKIASIWADDRTLGRVASLVKGAKPEGNARILCHGSRNGYEVKRLQAELPNATVEGTDISETATEYGLVQWDFHDEKEEWVGVFDCIYTNSWDQSWKPALALETWLKQINEDGMVVIEHTDAHSPIGASKIDPFGVRPVAFPFLVTKWFENTVTIKWSVDQKSNMDLDAYLFVLQKCSRSSSL